MPNKKLKVAVLYGGISNERDISIMTGKNIIGALDIKKYSVHPIEIAKNGSWKLKEKGKTRVLTVFDDHGGHVRSDLKKFDVVFIGLHGKYAEDGTIQSILDLIQVPYTGSGVMASALGMNKLKALELTSSIGIKTPKFIEILNGFKVSSVEKKIGYPCVVKPNNSGSSVGVCIVKNRKELLKAIRNAFKEDDRVLVEEYIKGREFTCAVMGNARKTKLFTFPPIEIKSSEKFFDYHAKYFSKDTEEICPAPINKKLTKKIQELSLKIHEILECDGVTRSDFMFKNKTFYFLEINTLPGMTSASLCPKSAEAIGMSFSKFLDAQITLALEK